MNQPSSPPCENTFPVEINLPSSFAASSGALSEFDHSSGATSGSPFSFIDVNVGTVSPGTSSTLHSYPCVRIILSISAIACADDQFIFAIVTDPQSASFVSSLSALLRIIPPAINTTTTIGNIYLFINLPIFFFFKEGIP